MRPKRRATHAVYDLKVHLVWITKYRYKVLTKDVGKEYGHWFDRPALLMI